LAALLREEAGLEALPAMARAPGGKPFFPDRPDLFFSLSHAGDLALCALAAGPVGCDIELVRPRRAGFPRYCLDEREYAWFRARGARWEDFYALWTLKEAQVKCTGEGLVRPAREIAVPCLAPGEPVGENRTDVSRETSLWPVPGEGAGSRCTALAGVGWRGAVWEILEEGS